MGLIIGSIIGFKFGGWFGMVALAWLGYTIEQRIAGKNTGSQKEQIQASFFNALFLCMGKLAKVDGTVSASEIERTEGVMLHMKLNAEMRQRAIQLFNQGKDPNYSIDNELATFGRMAKRSLSLKQIFLEMLVDIAEADGDITQAESDLIERVCHLIGYPIQLFHAMMKMRGFAASAGYQQNRQQGYSGHQQRNRNFNSNAPFNPYQVLGVDSSESKATIRKAYKRLMSQHHPDKLVSKGLPPEMMKVAEEKAKQIQLAWEKVKDLKGW